MKYILFMFINVCLICLSLCAHQQYEICRKSIACGNQSIQFPFYIGQQPEAYCGYPGFELGCINNLSLVLNISAEPYIVDEIFYNNYSLRLSNVFTLDGDFCSLQKVRNLTFPSDRRFELSSNSSLVLLSNCSRIAQGLSEYKIGCDQAKSDYNSVLAMNVSDPNISLGIQACTSVVVAPVDDHSEVYEDKLDLLRNGFVLKWTTSDCTDCQLSGGYCGYNGKSNIFKCFCSDRPHSRSCKSRNGINSKLILGTAVAGACLVVFFSAFFIFWRHKKLNLHSTLRLKRDTSSDIEEGASHFGVPVFSYKELEEATHNFDPSKELGDGGFGTVYHGKLKDGRDVAVKRCYENSYRRVEQFMNEIKILTHLRHHNLVVLYGSSSHQSQDLLLVYEYVPNGTVADHIHGDKSKFEPLMWPVRINIAIETASALSYLHRSEIVHRDVKTNNILLDNSFCVKVADFGLSRLFPTDVTHVSTAPQGTPGYVDPDYHQCYQLTDKSDVYSFGVVLIELISSLPAVDINRQRNEINLANLAVDRIQRCALDELIDPVLGQDASTVRMTTSVAELAFRCLQLDKDLRPTMDEVLESLEQIRGMDQEKTAMPPPSPETEDVVLLKENSKLRDSPVTVIDKWISTSTTPGTSR